MAWKSHTIRPRKKSLEINHHFLWECAVDLQVLQTGVSVTIQSPNIILEL